MAKRVLINHPSQLLLSCYVVHVDKPSCGFWRTAKVNQLLTSKDGLVRGVVVRITLGRD